MNGCNLQGKKPHTGRSQNNADCVNLLLDVGQDLVCLVEFLT